MWALPEMHFLITPCALRSATLRAHRNSAKLLRSDRPRGGGPQRAGDLGLRAEIDTTDARNTDIQFTVGVSDYARYTHLDRLHQC